MQKRLNWMLLMLLIALVAFAGCSDDDGGRPTRIRPDAAVDPEPTSVTFADPALGRPEAEPGAAPDDPVCRTGEAAIRRASLHPRRTFGVR